MIKHVVVTGGAGFIGSHLCDLLLDRGYAVSAVDNLVTGRLTNLEQAHRSPRFSFLERDVCEPLSIMDLPLAREFGLYGVLHFACPASPVDFVRLDREIHDVLTIGTQRMLDLTAAHSARFVLASTSEIYGNPGTADSRGSAAVYVESKRLAETIVESVSRDLRLRTGVVRIFNTYGPRMRSNDGRLIPSLCRRFWDGQPLLIEGDGEQKRSFCYVNDLVKGVVRYFESDLRPPVDLGGSEEISILDLVAELKAQTARPLTVLRAPARVGDVLRRCPDLAIARNQLGWNPEISIAVGLSRMLESYQRR